MARTGLECRKRRPTVSPQSELCQVAPETMLLATQRITSDMRESLQRCRSNREDSRGEQIRKADVAVHLGTHADFRAYRK
jgi:hypothetical protein